MHSFALIFLILDIWQIITFRILLFLSVYFAMVETLISTLFAALIFNMYIKLTCIAGISFNFLIHIFIIFLRIIFALLLGFFIFYFYFLLVKLSMFPKRKGSFLRVSGYYGLRILYFLFAFF